MVEKISRIHADKYLLEIKNKITALHQVAISLSKAKNEEEIYQITIDAAEKILDFDVCSIDIVEDGMFVVKATSSGVPVDGTVSLPVNEGIAGKTYQTGQSFLINDITNFREARPARKEYRSAISIPLDQFGIFQAIKNEIDAFTKDDLELAELLVSHTIAALKRINSEKRIRYLGFHDSLTGLYNRVYFDEELKRLNTPRQLPLSFIMGDVNGLKLVNDAFGHTEGDKLLKKIANIVKSSCRQEDIIARWGGDEFMVLLPKTNSQECNSIVQRIKRACQESSNDPIKPSIALGSATKERPEEQVEVIIRRAEDRMYRNKLKESKNATHSIISSLEKSLWDKDVETEEHSQRMKNLALKLGKSLGLTEEKLEELALLASLHDIGKLAVSDEILRKKSKLSEEEWSMICKHPEIGYRIAKVSPEIAPIAEDILCHHERWDGKGYPLGLKGKGIPLLARIIAIVDAFDVMTHERPYKKSISVQEAIEELKRNAGYQFDPELVKIFIEEILPMAQKDKQCL